ncbi:MAG: cysteine hydrolase [Clostridia bacterium]|nr:cysteine hydrolase [Clostridia bacterium]
MSQKAVLVIDMLEDFIRETGTLYVGEQGKEIIDDIKELLDRERSSGSFIIYICDNHLMDDAEFEMFPCHCVKGTKGAEIIEELAPQEGDYIIKKRRYSAFAGTDLEITLREKGIEELILVGVCTNICVLYTAADARNLHYKVIVPKNCVTSFDLEAHKFALKEMKNTLGVEVI